MAKHKVLTTDVEIDSAIERTRHAPPEPTAKSAEYNKSLDLIILVLHSGRRVAFPREDLQGLENATAKQLAKIELVGRGIGLRWEELDADLYVPALLQGVYGTQKWMSDIGRKGGKVTSVRKKTASRKNGAKGGRPKKLVAA